jgi:hypothetical protein
MPAGRRGIAIDAWVGLRPTTIAVEDDTDVMRGLFKI